MAIGKRRHPNQESVADKKRRKENHAVHTALHPGSRVLLGRCIIFLIVIANIVVEIGQFICGGTFGRVYKCRDWEANEQLALKVSRPGSDRKDAAYNEIRILEWLKLKEPSSTYSMQSVIAC